MIWDAMLLGKRNHHEIFFLIKLAKIEKCEPLCCKSMLLLRNKNPEPLVCHTPVSVPFALQFQFSESILRRTQLCVKLHLATAWPMFWIPSLTVLGFLHHPRSRSPLSHLLSINLAQQAEVRLHLVLSPLHPSSWHSPGVRGNPGPLSVCGSPGCPAIRERCVGAGPGTAKVFLVPISQLNCGPGCPPGRSCFYPQ